MIIVTGGSGFIGSNVVAWFGHHGRSDIIVSDRLDDSGKWRNLADKHIADYVDKDDLFAYLEDHRLDVDAFIHLGARTDTMDTDAREIMKDNFEFSKRVWEWCTLKKTKLIYASSASVYGDGHLGYDESADISRVAPLNAYAYSKSLFDRWVALQREQPEYWYGLRFFNVYGPGEAHKGRMASVVLHAARDIRKNGSAKLFKSYKSRYKHGEQERDFVYVKDVASCVGFFSEHIGSSGIYNVGSGASRTFNDLVHAVFLALGVPDAVEYIDMPPGLEETYQYQTVAPITKLRRVGYTGAFAPIEYGVADYLSQSSRI